MTVRDDEGSSLRRFETPSRSRPGIKHELVASLDGRVLHTPRRRLGRLGRVGPPVLFVEHSIEEKETDMAQQDDLEQFPAAESLTEVVIGAAPKQQCINLYLKGERTKATFQLDEKEAQYLVQALSTALDQVARGVQ